MPRAKPKRKPTRGENNIAWIEEYCRVPEGKFVGQPVRLRQWQKDEILKIYDNPTATRRAIISFGRKNGKTSFAAFLLLLHLCGLEAKHNSQLISAAQSRDQAAVLFALASKIVRLSPVLNACVVIRDSRYQLFVPKLGALYRALSAEVATAYGLSPAFICHDELGQVRGPSSELYDALETATGAQAEPLSVIISTQAPSDSDLLSVLIDDATNGHDPRTVVSLYTAPQDEDPFAIATIRKANPALGDFLSESEVLGMAQDAKRMPSREAEFRNLVLNQRVEASSPFVSRSAWKACGGEVRPLDGVPVYGGLDLSTTQDLTALVLIGRVEGIWQVWPTFWLPGDTIVPKSKADRVPYDVWKRAGYLHAAPGKSTDYEYVAEHLAEVLRTYDIRKLAFDRWNFKNLKPWLLRVGLDEEQIAAKFLEFGQGFQSMSPALRDLEAEIVNGRLAHGGHPVLTMCAANAVIQTDPAGNRKLAKNRSPGRIDGMVALAMAFGAAVSVEEDAPAHQMFFV